MAKQFHSRAFTSFLPDKLSIPSYLSSTLHFQTTKRITHLVVLGPLCLSKQLQALLSHHSCRETGWLVVNFVNSIIRGTFPVCDHRSTTAYHEADTARFPAQYALQSLSSNMISHLLLCKTETVDLLHQRNQLPFGCSLGSLVFALSLSYQSQSFDILLLFLIHLSLVILEYYQHP